jgi:hypothetical protein
VKQTAIDDAKQLKHVGIGSTIITVLKHAVQYIW